MATKLPVLGSGTVRGCCPLDCQDTCSWLAHVEDGRVVRLEGAKDHPITRGAFGNMARQRLAMGRPILDMHPADAAARQVGDGDEITVANARGALRAWARLTDTIHPGVVALPGKWWSSPDATAAVANLLTPSAWTPGGQPAYNDTFVEVTAKAVEPANLAH